MSYDLNKRGYPQGASNEKKDCSNNCPMVKIDPPGLLILHRLTIGNL